MRAERQDEVKAFLADPASHGTAGAVERIETHISAVFLAGEHAFKLKQAVRMPYADFSTPEIRLAACAREAELNAALTPGLYLGVRRITREAEGLAFDGEGPLVDAVVVMRRFDQESRFDRIAARGELTRARVVALADTIVAAHGTAEIARAAGGAENIAAVLDVNRAGFGESSVFCEGEIAALDDAFRAGLAAHASLLDARAQAGAVRRCHGDLHLRNVCLLDGRPRLFDCLDFNDSLATVDVLYDLAFMTMDLWQTGHRAEANLLANRYLDASEQEDGVALMPFFTALRAAVRAHVTATQSETAEPDAVAELSASARGYFDLAHAILEPRPARLVAIGGLSGSGKSTVAEALAPEIGPPPGARIVESDRVRKTLFGVALETRLPQEAYAADVSERVYATMADRARRLGADGASVVADAVFDRPERRAAIARAASAAGLPFVGLWLEADAQVLRERVETRAASASDATADILAAQPERDPGPIGWTRIPTARPLAETLAAIRRVLPAAPTATGPEASPPGANGGCS